ncbi:hypothetical protein LOD99_12933 [Oopsacas minuta]|uniref:LITAF domain-containing protein n=1 Tax=Oopsacas minuta TaxID=111878 RepID=A0AAV7JA75_9METZ|nr:hypothetical protein LOD99_12933 [Oopsacas minuta]
MPENNSTQTTPEQTTTKTNMEPNTVHSKEPLGNNGRSRGSIISNGLSYNYNTDVEWGKLPQEFICVNCKVAGISQTELKVGNLNWVMTAVCIICLCLCFCWICVPCGIGALFMDTFKDVNHICTNCGYINGTKKQMD